MSDEYNALVEEAKTLQQAENPEAEVPVYVVLPMAEDEWYTRPDTVSYGTINLEFEADNLTGDDRKTDIAYEGSLDLYSMVRSGAGWVPMICDLLTKHCGAAWYLNHHSYERETGLFHWEWVFQVEG